MDSLQKYPPFHVKAFSQYARMLSSIPDVPWERVAVLLASCPPVDEDFDGGAAVRAHALDTSAAAMHREAGSRGASAILTGNSRSNLMSNGKGVAELDSRARTAALACADFVVLSNGQFVQDVLAILLSYTEALPQLKWQAPGVAESFSLALLLALHRIGKACPETSELICDTVHDHITRTVSKLAEDKENKFILGVFSGTLQAVGVVPFPWQRKHTDQMLELLTTLRDLFTNQINDSDEIIDPDDIQMSFETNEVMPAKLFDVLEIMLWYQMASLSPTEAGPLDSSQFEPFFSDATNRLTEQQKRVEKLSGVCQSADDYILSERLTATCIDLVVQCAFQLPSLKSPVYQFLSDMLSGHIRSLLGLYTSAGENFNPIPSRNILRLHVGMPTPTSSLPSGSSDADSELTKKVEKEIVASSYQGVYQKLLSGLSSMAIKHSDLSAQILDALLSFFLSSHFAGKSSTDENGEGDEQLPIEILDTVMTVVADTLKALSDRGEVSLISSALGRLGNVLFAEEETGSQDDTGGNSVKVEGHAVNAAVLLGRIVSKLDSPDVSDQIMSIFVTRLANPPHPMDAVIVNQFVRVGLLERSKSYKQIADLLVALCVDPFNQKSRYALPEVPGALAQLGKQMKNPGLRRDLLERTLRLFTDLGLVIQHSTGSGTQTSFNATETKNSLGVMAGAGATSMAGRLGSLLPALALLTSGDLGDQHSLMNPSWSILSKFRNVWFYCVMYGFVVSGVWLEEWFNAVQTLAEHSPVLVSPDKTHNFLESEVEIESFLARNVKDEDVTEIRNALIQLLPKLQNQIRSFTFPQCSYLMSVYYLETLRARGGSFQPVFAYLADQGIAESPIAEAFRAIAVIVFKIYLQQMEEKPKDSKREDELAEQAQFLLVNFCHRTSRVRIMADRFVIMLVEQFPQVLWGGRCLNTLLDLLQAVAASCEHTDQLEETVVVLRSGHTLDLSPDINGREETLQNMTSLCSVWLKSAVAAAPVEMHSLLQNYVQDFDRLTMGRLSHFGASLAVHFGSLTKGRALHLITDRPIREAKEPSVSGYPSNLTRVLLEALDSNASNFVGSLELKSAYSGEISGMKHLIQDFNIAQASDFVQLLSTQLLTNFETVLEELNEGGRIDLQAFNETMYRAAALVVHEEKVNNELVKAICWSPARAFRAETLTTGIIAWNWVMTTRPELNLLILTEIAAAWMWTIDERKGLFSGSPRGRKKPNRDGLDPLSPFTSELFDSSTRLGDEASSASSSTEDGSSDQDLIAAHDIWIQFFADRFEVAHSLSLDQTDVFVRMMLHSLEDPLCLAESSSSVGTRFRFLRLAVRVLDYATFVDPMVETLLRERVFLGAMSWFFTPAGWFAVNRSLRSIEHDISSLISFCKFLRSYTKCHLAASSSASLLKGFQVEPKVVSSGDSTFSGTKAPASTISHRTGNVYMTISAKPPSEFFSRLDSNSDIDPSAKEKRAALHDAWRLTNLVLLLVGHEIDRLSAWYNPLRDPLRKIQDEDMFSVVKDSHGSDRWLQFVRLAWKIEPKLAVNLVLRFESIASRSKLRAEVERLVLENPTAVKDYSPAVKFLVTSENARNGVPQLRQLVHFAPVSPTVALQFLGPEFEHNPFIVQYACRILRALRPSVLIFFLPQLIQRLRNDTTGAVYALLADAAAASELTAHQIIWNIRTEADAEGDEVPFDRRTKTPPDDPFKQLLWDLRQKIIFDFSPEARQHYEMEFEFFQRLTAMSHLLMPYKKDKNLLQEKLKEGLQKISIDGPVYLPSNPDEIVTGINCDTAAGMQSHSRVPLKIDFSVRHHDINKGFDDLDGLEYEPEPRTCSAIFKTKDDVRQDVLAVQIVAMFKKIFKSAGLDVWLCPYRVVATAPQCGVIEHVQAKSRDQLGRISEDTTAQLYYYFLNKYGPTEGKEFELARRNFTQSMAAYSVISYLLQMKDRHNGNVMVDDDGHIVHIDFGFMFDISPGMNIKFERAPFKLTDEMIKIMGGSAESESFKWFMEQVARSYLAARPYLEEIVAVVEPMMQTDLPCFTAQSITRLRSRFSPEQSDKQAVQFIKEKVMESYDKFTTLVYDQFQMWQNGIEF